MEYEKEGASSTHSELLNLQWKYTPPTPEVFLEDDYFMGEMGRALYPKLQEHFIEICNRKDIVEIILTGSIGWGKDYLSVILGAYEYVRLGCLKNPQKYLGIAPNTPVVGSVLNVTSTKSSEYYDNFMEAIDSMPFFKDNFPRDPRKNSILKFPNRVIFKDAGSTEMGAIGSNNFFSVLNEMNFMKRIKGSKKAAPGKEEYNQALSLYQQISRRLKSRFLLN
jgi:hypothetical protein